MRISDWSSDVCSSDLLPSIFDEPFADSSQIPTYLISRVARERVTVVLSGDGGDELFAGYGRYHQILAFWRRWGWLPAPARAAAGDALAARGRAAWPLSNGCRSRVRSEGHTSELQSLLRITHTV